MRKLTALLLLLPVLASTDPGPAAQYLLNEPASLMDIGIVRLNLTLQEYRATIASEIDKVAKTELTGFDFSSTYDPDTDRLEVRMWIYPEESMHAESACRNLLLLVRQSLPIRIRESFGHITSKPTDELLDIRTAIIESTLLYCEATDLLGNTLSKVSLGMGASLNPEFEKIPQGEDE